VKKALVAVAATAAALAASATPALADGFSLKLTATSTPTVGRSLIIRADGTMPPDDVQFPYWFSLIALRPSVMPNCPHDMWEAVQIGRAAGGATVTLQQRERPDTTGSFSVPVAVTPTSPGSVLLCGYTDDGLTTTLAMAQLTINIQSGSSASAERPVNPPVQVRRDIRVCVALLGKRGARGCIRSAVKRANANCRHRYRSHRRQARCVRSVRRVARSHR
jgi:hypothetical protein